LFAIKFVSYWKVSEFNIITISYYHVLVSFLPKPSRHSGPTLRLRASRGIPCLDRKTHTYLTIQVIRQHYAHVHIKIRKYLVSPAIPYFLPIYRWWWIYLPIRFCVHEFRGKPANRDEFSCVCVCDNPIWCCNSLLHTNRDFDVGTPEWQNISFTFVADFRNEPVVDFDRFDDHFVDVCTQLAFHAVQGLLIDSNYVQFNRTLGWRILLPSIMSLSRFPSWICNSKMYLRAISVRMRRPSTHLKVTNFQFGCFGMSASLSNKVSKI